jgi:hypothetical protein
MVNMGNVSPYQEAFARSQVAADKSSRRARARHKVKRIREMRLTDLKVREALATPESAAIQAPAHHC